MKTIRRYSDPAAAHVAQSMLESAGISSYLKNENAISVYPLYSSSVGYLELQVNEDEIESALEILGREVHNSENVNRLTRKINRSMLILFGTWLIVSGIFWVRFSFDMNYFGNATAIGFIGLLGMGVVLWFLSDADQ